jgi:hypothetical protein
MCDLRSDELRHRAKLRNGGCLESGATHGRSSGERSAAKAAAANDGDIHLDHRARANPESAGHMETSGCRINAILLINS